MALLIGVNSLKSIQEERPFTVYKYENPIPCLLPILSVNIMVGIYFIHKSRVSSTVLCLTVESKSETIDIKVGFTSVGPRNLGYMLHDAS